MGSMTQPVSSSPGFVAPLPTSTPREQAPAVPADVFAPSGPGEALPTRAAMAAASRSKSTSVEATGSVNGRPFQWTVGPAADDRGTRITGAQNLLPVDARVVSTGTGARIEGHQNGRPLYVEIDRREDGSLHVEGRRNNRGLLYDVRSSGSDAVAEGAQDGMTSSFQVRRTYAGVDLQGAVGGVSAGASFTDQGSSVSVQGGAHGLPLGVTFQGTGIGQFGDFLPGLSLQERAAVVFVLMTPNPLG